MRTLILNHDLKTLAQGASAAAVCGLLLGATLHPNLDAEPRPGPQMQMNSGGARADTSMAATPVAYTGAPPEYVVGTDWTRPHVAQAAEPPLREEDMSNVMAYVAEDYATPAVATRASYVEPPREAADYPSRTGGQPYEANRPAPPPPPSNETDEADQG